ncbi:glycosyltransferase [Anaeromicrobium sediminis]|uniref:Glycosyl transferase family 1 domain-containing protein n=1 Tax=Anaeromicrobium sediminis TaxID=1478221 RepID=A0A267MI74_9FIRM|nr:glycosyltransferase [Anaeromicrobium sediminis]PAB59147.1 hypothetical protein CCE28_11555 [Anaeromicrobium sediminis]
MDLNEKHFDFVILTPNQQKNSFYYDIVKKFARDTNANLVLLNFESPNWFNKYSPIYRAEDKWTQWLKCCEESCLILCSAKESIKYAKEYYTLNAEHVYFDYWYPSINSKAADSVDPKKEKRIVVITRLSDKHKGSDDILEIFDQDFWGYTLVFIIGLGKIEYKYIKKLEEIKKKYNISYELKYKVTDEEKFNEIKKAELMLFPSYFEGFGYPPVEAQYCGTKCIVYDLPVLRETSKENLIYAKWGDIKDLKKKVKENLNKSYSPEKLKKKIIKIADFHIRAKAIEEVLLRHKLEKKPLKKTTVNVLPKGIYEYTSNSFDFNKKNIVISTHILSEAKEVGISEHKLDRLNNRLFIAGWSYPKAREVSIYVNYKFIGNARLDVPRNDVNRRFNLSNDINLGWVFEAWNLYLSKEIKVCKVIFKFKDRSTIVKNIKLKIYE